MIRKVALYVVLPEARQLAPVRRSPVAAAKAWLRRRVEALRWRLGGIAPITLYVWTRREDSNKGDIGIREAIKEQLRAAFPGDELVFTELGWGTLDEAAVARINADHALFVIGGSGYIALDGAGKLPPRVDRDLAAFERIRCPKIAYGVGINYWLAELSQDHAMADPQVTDRLRRLLGLVSAISVRDERTLRALQPLASRPIALTGDPALFLAGAPPVEHRTPGTLRIGLNLALHDQGLVPLFATLLPELVRCCRAIAARRPVAFVYFTHAEVDYVVPRLLRQRGIAVEVIEAEPRAMLAAYAGLDLHLCQMLHSAIFAINAGVPTVNIGYDVKNFAFFELMALPEYCLAPGQAVGDRLLERAETALADPETLRRRIVRRKAELRQELDGFVARDIPAAALVDGRVA